MSRVDELVSEEFAKWEQRGRGWKVWPQPVRPEPPFEEFTGYRLAQSQLEVDDGRRPGLLASLFDSLERRLNPKPPAQPEAVPEPEPNASEEPLTAEFLASLPASLDASAEAMSAFLGSADTCAEPIGFELVGNHESVRVQFVSSANDAPALQRQLAAFVPKLAFTPSQEELATAWSGSEGIGFIVDFGLAHELMLPLHTGHALDPFVGLVAALGELQRDEVGVFQVLFQPVQHRWPASVWRSVTDANGKALFVNRPHLIPGTKEKLEAPLFGVVVRAAAKAESFERSAAIVRDMAFALRSYTRHEGNRLIPLHNDDYPFEAHEEDLLLRQSRRSGMLLNRDELLGFVHLPSDEVRAPKLRRQRTNSKAAPALVLSPPGVLLGHNPHAGRTAPVYLSAEQRTRHTHIIGASGTGKSTLLFNLIRQDIESGAGVAVLDPHGELVERILGIIPPERIGDVVLVDPSDEDYSVGFNILHAHSNLERTLLASDLVSVFRRLSTSWGDQMDAVLKNAILAFLHSSRRGTLLDLRRFLLESDFRNQCLASVTDPEIVYYWQRGFPLLAGTKSIGPIITRLNDFLATATIRCMVSQTENRLDFADIMDTGKIFLAKLPEGLVGKKDSHLLGALLVSKFQQVAMSRQAQQAATRRDFWIYADEFDNFITPSMAEILKGTRKYRVGLMLAHHELHQLQRDPDVASAVLSNTATRVVFRVGDEDARKLAEGFASFEARDLRNLGTGEAIARVERSEFDFNLTVPQPTEPDATTTVDTRKRVITVSRERYARPRAEIEAGLLQQFRRAESDRPSEVPQAKPKPVSRDAAEAKAAEDSKLPVPEIVVAPPAASPLTEEPTVSKPSAQAKPSELAKPTAPRDMGIGGAQHQAIQQRLKREAETFGFRATIEKEIPDGSVDLLLERPGHVIACEISVTTTIDHEVGNVAKCLKAGFARVAIICQQEERLRRIEAAIASSLGPDAGARASYFQPDPFLTYLQTLASEPKPVPPPVPTQPTKRRGYNVKRKVADLERDEHKAREAAEIKLIAEIMGNKPL